MITIRAATFNDIPAMLPLIEQLGYPTTRDVLEKRFEYFMNREGYGIAVVCSDEQLIGWVAWSQSQLFISDKKRLHIEGLVVDRQYRGQGVGKKLLTFVEDFARKYYAPAIIDLTSGLRRAQDGSHEFYKSLGYKNEGAMAKLYLRKEIK
jgi:GNAT superfamily N-acetyltransferase